VSSRAEAIAVARELREAVTEVDARAATVSG
jgi:hypothetical protein